MTSMQRLNQTAISVVCTSLFFLTTTMGALADEVDVYLLGGQSNMQGIAKLANLPRDVVRQVPNVFFYNGKSFDALKIGTTKTSNREREFGPEIGFALELADSKRPVYLIKYAASGMPLHRGWNGNKWVGGVLKSARRNFYPGQSSDDKAKGTLYRQMLQRFQTGIRQLKKEGHRPVVRGFVWMQGEQDSKNEVSATTYAASLKQLCDRVQEDIKVSADFGVVYGQVLPFEPALDRFTHRSEVRAQMAAADRKSNGDDCISNATMISTDSFGLLPDTVHYNAAGQLRLGSEFGKAMKQLHSDLK